MRVSLLLVLTICILALATFMGGGSLRPKEVWAGLCQPHSHLGEVVWQLRLPRVLLAVLIGAGLAAAGFAFQNMLRNPLASPFTLGVSSGAAAGAVACITLGLNGSASWLNLPAFSFLGALLATAVVYAIATWRKFTISMLILAGIILSYFFSSAVLLLQAISTPGQLHGAMMWLMGNLGAATWLRVLICTVALTLSTAVFMLLARELDALRLGEEKASFLGVSPQQVTKVVFVFASVLAGTCVAAAGVIGFVGLVVPHFARKLVSERSSLGLPGTMLLGASFLLLCDTLSRRLPGWCDRRMSAVELPVGVTTGIIGCAIFIGILVRSPKWRL
jgi:iron complex transport system permease protein